MTTRYPNGYGQAYVTLEEMKARHAPMMHPEFARRFFRYVEAKGGLLGVGGGFRTTQPVGPGFAPPGKSFHEAQQFASGIVGYCAVDLVCPNPGGNHRAPTWAECADAPQYLLHTFIAGEPWHIQPLEIRGWQTWVDAGRPDPATPAPPPPPPVEDDTVRIGYVRMAGTPAVYEQWSNGTKTWVRDGDVLNVLRFIDPALTVTELPNAAWLRAAGPIVGPKPAGVDGWGVPL